MMHVMYNIYEYRRENLSNRLSREEGYGFNQQMKEKLTIKQNNV